MFFVSKSSIKEGVFFSFDEVCGLVQNLMFKIFDEYGQKRSDNLQDAETSDQEFVLTFLNLQILISLLD